MGVSAKISWEGCSTHPISHSRLSDEKIYTEFQLTNLDIDQSDGRQLAQLLGAQGMGLPPTHRRAQCALAAARTLPHQTKCCKENGGEWSSL